MATGRSTTERPWSRNGEEGWRAKLATLLGRALARGVPVLVLHYAGDGLKSGLALGHEAGPLVGAAVQELHRVEEGLAVEAAHGKDPAPDHRHAHIGPAAGQWWAHAPAVGLCVVHLDAAQRAHSVVASHCVQLACNPNSGAREERGRLHNRGRSCHSKSTVASSQVCLAKHILLKS